MKLLSIDGIMGAGKSYLFNLLKENFAHNKKNWVCRGTSGEI